MYKLMLIDDDIPMLKYLQKMLQWSNLELDLCASTHSSLKALQLFEETLPDIVVTDIGLPQVNGLELVERFKKIKPTVRTIFLTCHEDFHYAKRALELNADEYLVKDELTPEQLQTSLKKSLQNVTSLSDNLELYSFRETVEKNKDLLKQHFFEKILISKDIVDIVDNGKRLGIRWDYSDFIVGSSFLDLSKLTEQYGFQDIPLIKYAIFNIAEELAENINGITPLLDKENNLYIIFNFKYTISRNILGEFNIFLKDLKNRVKNYLQLNINLLYSKSFVKLSSLGSEILKLNGSRYYYFYDDLSIQLLDTNHKSEWNLHSEGLINSLGNDIKDAFGNKDVIKLKRVLKELRALSEQNNINPEHIIENGVRWIRLMEVEIGSSLNNDNFVHYFRQSIKLQDVVVLLEDTITKLINKFDVGLQKKPKLHEIDQFIIDHLSENISSVDMANHLYLNPSYFSRYFKRLSGKNFTDYYHRFKINFAEKMLKEKEENIEELASLLGYSDRTYFSKIFKKYTGLSPGEYKLKEKKH